jgi:hypothetical protein
MKDEINAPPPIGHNGGPNPLDEALIPFDDAISMAETWLDGTPVENAAQMAEVDNLTAELKAAKKAVETAKEGEYRPLKEACEAVVTKYAPTIKDLDRLVKGLVACVDGFKRKLAAEKEAVRQEAVRKAYEVERAAKEAAMKADATNIEAQRAADAAMLEAEIAHAKAAAAKNDTVKGLRLTWFHEVTDTSTLLKWINKHDRAALDDFCEEYAKAHRTDGVVRDGMRAWQDRVAV